MADATDGDTKDVKGEPITIRLKDQAGEETVFRIRETTKMQKVFRAYAQRRGLSINNIRFLVDGQRVRDDDTPSSLELGDGDQVDVFLEQQGGC